MDLYIVRDFFETVHERKEFRYILAGLLLLGIGAAAFGIHAYFAQKKTEKAQSLFAQNLELFNNNLHAKPEEQRWNDVAQAFAQGYEQYSSTAFGPFFLGYQAETQLAQNQNAQAHATLERMVQSMKKSSPLYYLYATKLALVQRDLPDPEARAAGEKALEDLAMSVQNPDRDWAASKVAQTAFYEGDLKKAEKFYQLVQQQAETSPWAPLAAQKLAELVEIEKALSQAPTVHAEGVKTEPAQTPVSGVTPGNTKTPVSKTPVKTEGSKAPASKAEGSKAPVTKVPAPKTEGSQPLAPKTEELKTEAPRPAESQAPTPKPSASRAPVA